MGIGLGKSSPAFYQAILTKLKVPAELAKTVTMIGDSYDKDIAPAIAAGLSAIWFNKNNSVTANPSQQIKQINALIDLI